MYIPSDDTFLLAECIVKFSGGWALDIGVGSGFLLRILEKNFDNVAGSDIDLKALQYSKQRSPGALLVCCDAASAFGNCKFDLIVSNPPYLPCDGDDDGGNDDEDGNAPKDQTVNGGRRGVETTIHFIKSAVPLLARDGKMLLVVSSLADSSALDIVFEENKIHKKIVKKKRLFYETLSVLQLSA
jgi:release factor glutamine methyltransferase